MEKALLSVPRLLTSTASLVRNRYTCTSVLRAAGPTRPALESFPLHETSFAASDPANAQERIPRRDVLIIHTSTLRFGTVRDWGLSSPSTVPSPGQSSSGVLAPPRCLRSLLLERQDPLPPSRQPTQHRQPRHPRFWRRPTGPGRKREGPPVEKQQIDEPLLRGKIRKTGNIDKQPGGKYRNALTKEMRRPLKNAELMTVPITSSSRQLCGLLAPDKQK